MVDGQAAVVGAAAAGGQGCLKLEIFDFIEGEHCRLLSAVIALAGDQSRAEGAHNAGDVGTCDLPARDGLHTAQNGIIIEGAALDDDIFAQLGGVGDLDNLEEGILDDRVSQAGGDVGDIRAFLLRLFDTGIHKYGAARSQVDGMLCEQGRFCEILYRKIKRFGKCLDKGTAARGAGFVEQDIVHRVVFDADAFHVLSADIENAVDFGVEESRRIVVGDGLYLAFIQKEGRLEQGFAVTGRAAAHDLCLSGKQAVDFRDRRNSSPDGAAVIVAVKRVQKRAVLADQGQLGCRGTRVDSQEAVSAVSGQVGALYTGLFMAAAELVVFLL